ncbi:MAG TPA: amino acid ABC transporter permease [Ramlibacter sp.]|uniref:amino acid ABC transporter permease n=1 Tax=Ramlibacter sp. TaxID=1917967 RepID=UPI002B8A977A|nr:amino acid ABC transporter permease [Ramlibacter sp.]HVZ45379.1 amino acid ABC transporter permease [Ramlibacter sp.]
MAWDWQVFCKETTTGEVISGCLAGFAKGQDQTYLNWLITAWGWTLAVAILSLIVALVAGLVVGTLRTLPNSPWLVRFANSWVELFRNVPLLVQIFLWYFVVPGIFPAMKDTPPLLLVILALGLFTSARIAEQVRAGIQALPRGQRYAGLALGLTTAQTYRYVLLPMALRIVIPPLTSESMNIIKNSSVAFAVSITELTFFARQSGEETSAPVQMYMAVTVLYAISAFVINRVMRVIERRTQVPGFVAAGGMGGH